MPKYHHAFSAFAIEPGVSTFTDLVAAKIEPVKFGPSTIALLDVLVRDRAAYYVLQFARLIEREIVWHSSARAVSPSLLSLLAERLLPWLSAVQPGHSVFEFFGRDPELEALVRGDAQSGVVFPGCSTYDEQFTAAERYACVAPYLMGASVVDLRPASGYGLQTLRAIARELVVRAHAQHPFAYHFPQLTLPQAEDARTYETVLALDVRRDEIDETIEVARACVKDGGRVILSVRDAGDAALLASKGFELAPMVRPGGDPLGALDETLAILAPRPSVSAAWHREPVEVGPRKLRVLMVQRPSHTFAFGGDVVQIRETARALRERGHDVVLTDSAQPDPNGFDIVHLTNLTSPFETLEQAKAVERFDGPIVLMPIFIDHADETVWGMNAVAAAFGAATDETTLHNALLGLAARTVTTANIPPPPARPEMTPHYTSAQHEIVRRIDFVIANAHSEMHRFYRYLSPDVPYAIAPSCADPAVYGTHAREAFRARFGFEDFVLTTGRLEARKNQLLLFEALRELPYPLVCIGKGAEADYSSLVRAYRSPTVVFLPFVPESELAGAYAAARVVALPSWDEVVSLTSLNAAISEASMVLTRNSYEHEYFRDDAEYCDPADVADIRRAVTRAWESHSKRAVRRRALALRARSEFSWDRSAEMTEAAYYRVLAHNPRGVRRRSNR